MPSTVPDTAIFLVYYRNLIFGSIDHRKKMNLKIYVLVMVIEICETNKLVTLSVLKNIYHYDNSDVRSVCNNSTI